MKPNYETIYYAYTPFSEDRIYPVGDENLAVPATSNMAGLFPFQDKIDVYFLRVVDMKDPATWAQGFGEPQKFDAKLKVPLETILRTFAVKIEPPKVKKPK